MQDFLLVTGMVIKTEPIGEYDRRIVILSKERGKISAFAKGSRRPNSKLMASTNPFCFGQFKIYPGRNSYTVVEAEISNYFETLRIDFEAAYYGMYFLEICDYYTRENNDEREMLKLLYQSLRALQVKSLQHKLVRCIFEIKAIVINGEFPGIPEKIPLQDSTILAIRYIIQSSIEKLYTFTVNEQTLKQLISLCLMYCRQCMDHEFKSIEILENIE